MARSDITKRYIADAMKQLMREKPFAKISVGDIVESCGINRNSFYYHFKDKYDLVNWIFYTELTHELTHEEMLQNAPWGLIRQICTFFYNDKEFYQNALSVTGQNSFSEYFIDLLKSIVMARTNNIFVDGEDCEFISTFYTDAFVSTIFRWLSEGAHIPPDKLTDLLKKATTEAAEKLLLDD